MFVLSAFADEYDQDFDKQLKACRKIICIILKCAMQMASMLHSGHTIKQLRLQKN